MAKWLWRETHEAPSRYGVATISRLHKKLYVSFAENSLFYRAFAKETYDLKEPSHFTPNDSRHDWGLERHARTQRRNLQQHQTHPLHHTQSSILFCRIVSFIGLFCKRDLWFSEQMIMTSHMNATSQILRRLVTYEWESSHIWMHHGLLSRI